MTTQEKIDVLLECIEKAQKLGIAATQNEFAELIGYSPVTLSAALANRGGKLTHGESVCLSTQYRSRSVIRLGCPSQTDIYKKTCLRPMPQTGLCLIR